MILTSMGTSNRARAQETFRDEFSTVSYSNNDGTQNWATDWLETGESNGASKGDIRIVKNLGSNRLRIKDNDRFVEREADLSPYSIATLSFVYRRTGLDALSDSITVEVSSNGGSSWTILDRFTGPATDGGYTAVNYDISQYITQNTRIRFATSPSLGNSDRLYVDDVQIAVLANNPPVALDDAATTDADIPVAIDVLANDSDPDNNLTIAWKSLPGINAMLDANGDDLFIPFTPENSGTLGDTRPDGKGIGLASDSATLTDDDATSGSVSYVYSFSNGSPFLPNYYFDPVTGEFVLTFNDIDFKPVSLLNFGGSGLDILFQETVAITFLANASDTPGPVDILMDQSNYGNYRPDGFGETNNVTVEYRVNLQNDLGVTPAEFDSFNADGEFGLYVTFSVIIASTDLDPGSTNTATLTNSAESMIDAFRLDGSCYAVPAVTGQPANGTVTLDGATKQLVYTPNPGFAGTDTFTYQICDAASACDTATVTVTVNPLADLSLTQTVDEPAPLTNDPVTFTLALTNTGPNDATGVTVTDVLPDSLTYFSAIPLQGTYDNLTGLWDVGTIPVGATLTLSITATVEAFVDPQTNIAEVAAANERDPDSTPGNSIPTEDDQDNATVTPSGSSGGGGAGMESDGSLAKKLARMLFRRRHVPETTETIDQPAFSAQVAGKSALSSLIQFVPPEGPEQSKADEVSPTDLLPVTNATGVFAVDYLRADSRRLAALFATTTANGEIYEHTKVVCDRLRGATLESVRLMEVDGHPFVLSRLRQENGAIDYAVSFAVYPAADAYSVDSRFRYDEYKPPAGKNPVFNFQVWSVSQTYTANLVQGILDRLAARGSVTFVNTDSAPPALPEVYVQSGRYAEGMLTLRMYNAVGAHRIHLTGGTMARTESGERLFFEKDLTLPVAESDASPVVTVDVPVGPVYDVAFFVEADGEPGKDQLYLADGAWSFASDPEHSTVNNFVVTPEDGSQFGKPGRFKLERDARLEGNVETWAVLFRYMQSSGRPMDLSAYQFLEFTSWGEGQIRLLFEKAGLASADQFGTVFKLGRDPQQHRIWFHDLRRNNGAGNFTAEDLLLLSFYIIGNQAHTRAFDFHVSDVRFGGGTGDLLAATPDEIELTQNYPNPFSNRTTIDFGLPEAGPVRLDVYDMLGRRVAVLTDAPYEAGRHSIPFDARGLAGGVYLYRLTTAKKTLTRTMIRVR